MQHEKKPSTLLNILCILLPFPVTLFLPLAISFFVPFALVGFTNKPIRQMLAMAIPITYIIFVALEFVLAIIFVKTASSPRNKAAARCFFQSIRIIVVLFILLIISAFIH